jgi:predicted MFS family arabinose efflux permease
MTSSAAEKTVLPSANSMSDHRFGPNFPRLFAAALLQELSFALLVHAPGYFSELGATEGLIGLLYAAGGLLSLLFRPLLGRILDLTHRRTVLLVAAVGNIAVLTALAGTSEWGPYLWGLFLAQRTIQIALFTTMLTYGADAIPAERRTQGLAIFGLSGLIPIAVGGYSGDVIVSEFGFSGLFIFSATVSLASWFVVWTLPVLPVRGRQPRRSFWAALVQRNMLPLWFASLMFAIGLEAMFTFTRTFVDDRDVGTAGLFFAVYGVAAATTRIAGGPFYDQIPHRPLLVGSISAYGLGLSLLGSARGMVPFVLAAVVTGIAHGAAFPVLSSEVVNRARIAERGSAMAVFTSIFDIAVLAGVPVVGFMIDGLDYLAAFSFVGVTLLGGALVYRFWDRAIQTSGVAIEDAA